MRRAPLLPPDFYRRSVEAVARDLLGQRLVHGDVILRITEVEAYAGPEDSASHARHGRTTRNAVMWGPGGHAYLYLCYGLHWMLNVATGDPEEAGAVLIRGAEVETGLDVVLARRGQPRTVKGLLSGPGKVGQALALDRSFDGSALFRSGGLELREGTSPGRIEATPRIGIGFAAVADQARPWRFLAR
ncbi:MAG: DNA-3-methyladenine glycosylase [Holophagaceae bacterium]